MISSIGMFAQSNEAQWRTRDGRIIAVRDMDTNHIQNTLAMLRRKGFVGPRTVLAYLSGPRPSGDGAQDAFNEELAEIATRPINPFVDIFEAELERRGAKQ